MTTLRPTPPPRSRWTVLLIVSLGAFVVMQLLTYYGGKLHRPITYSEFYRILETNPTSHEITDARLVDDRVEGRLKNGTVFSVYVPLRDEELLKVLRQNVPTFDVQPPQAGFLGILMAFSPWIIFLGIMWFVMRSAQGGGRLLAFGKSRARLISPETHTRVTFDDVAGIDEAKEELREIIEFLKDPKRFQRLGGKIPKGVLLIGLPGTGKTLLAKAVAGEANVPFYSISGSDFVEMFVGVGASVTGDTPILIKTDDGTRLTTIGEFVDSYYDGDTEGHIVHVEGVQTLGFAEKDSKFERSPKRFFGRSDWASVRGVYRHRVKEICEIHYLGGVIRTTGDHSVFVRTRNGIHPKLARDLREGDVLVSLPMKVRGEFSPLLGTPHSVRGHEFAPVSEPIELPLWEEDPTAQEHYAFALAQRETMSQQAIGHAIGVSQATVGNWQNGKHAPRALSRNYTDVDLPDTVTLTPSLMKLFGYYTAEGRCNNSLEFVFGAHETDLHADCIARVREVFGLEPSVEITADHTARIRFGSATLGRFFARYCGNGSHNKHIPPALWELPLEYFEAYVEGYARGDGYTTQEGKLSMTSVSHQLIRELAWLCAMHGIKAGVREMELKGGRVIKETPLPAGKAWNLIIGKTSHPFARAGVRHPAQGKKPYVREVIITPYGGYVYDLCGCDHEAFFGGEKPLLLHNSRVRDLFEQARRNARQGAKGAIIFIDEIDAVGRQRFAGIGGGHDEREQTLNALLVEMDGFDTQEGIILMAATNRPDVLDPALLRPGRFDRQVVISLPDIVGREAILKVHTRKIKLAKDVDLKSVARQTPGFSGADLANLANESALLAARLNKEVVGIGELEQALERVIAGPERKTRVLNDREKKVTAYHESGHALVALLTPETDPLHKVSIIPRGAHALGYTMQLPLEDRYTMSKRELTARMTVMMGGRAAEELVFNEITTGAQNDIESATEMARRMICVFGMSDRLGNLTYGRRERQMFLGRDLFEERNYSEQTAVMIDEEIRRLIDASYERARQTLIANRSKLELLATTLLDREVLDGEEVKCLVGLPARADQLSTPPQPSERSSADPLSDNSRSQTA